MFFEFPWATQQFFAGAIDKTVADISLIILAAVFRELGLGIEQVDMGRPTVHEHGDHGGGTGSMVRGSSPQVEGQIFSRLSGAIRCQKTF